MEGTIGWGRGPVVNCPSTPMITVSTDARTRVGNRGCRNSRTNHLLIKIFKMAAKSYLFEGLE